MMKKNYAPADIEIIEFPDNSIDTLSASETIPNTSNGNEQNQTAPIGKEYFEP